MTGSNQPGFNISGMANKIAQDVINVSFKSIQNLIDDYKPLETEQDFQLFFYSGPLSYGEKLYLDEEPVSATNIYGTYNSGKTIFANNCFTKVGVLNTNGEFVSCISADGEEELEDGSIWREKVTIYQPYRIDRLKNKSKRLEEEANRPDRYTSIDDKKRGGK